MALRHFGHFFGFFLGVFIPLFSLHAQSEEDAAPAYHENTWNYQNQDSFYLDSHSIQPHSLSCLTYLGGLSDTLFYDFYPFEALLVKKPHPPMNPDSLHFRFLRLPIDFKAAYQRKAENRIDAVDKYQPYTYAPTATKSASQSQTDDFNLFRSGQLSRGIQGGSQGGVLMRSQLDMQLSGQLSDDIDIDAVITDRNLPIQPEGTTAQLQDFDQVYIQLTRNNDKLIAGDFEMRHQEHNYFLKYLKKAQGVYVSTLLPVDEAEVSVYSGMSLARGRLGRNTFNGEEANQGPYRLNAESGQLFITIISGTERVFINGQEKKRGWQNDYVIDYQVGEVNFTPNCMIKATDRIVIEFQYANRNYERSIIQGGAQFQQGKWTFSTDFLSEQDMRGRPLFRELQTEDRATIRMAGNNPELLQTGRVDSTAFDGSRVQYEKQDSLGYEIFVYSTHPEKAVFRPSFSYVGPEQGNYRRSEIERADGAVYYWVAPVDGQPMGDYEPITMLHAPEKQQLFSASATYQFSENGRIGVEGAASVYDRNTLSPIDNENNNGLGLNVFLEQEWGMYRLGMDDWRLRLNAQHENKGADFNPIERYRSVEFDRTWNRTLDNPGQAMQLVSPEQEWYTTATLAAQKDFQNEIAYAFAHFNRATEINAFQHRFDVQRQIGRWKGKIQQELTQGSRPLPPEQEAGAGWEVFDGTRFWQHNAALSHQFDGFEVGVFYESEDNVQENRNTQVISPMSFRFLEYGAFFALPDTSAFPFKVTYSEREDAFPINNRLTNSLKARQVNFETQLLKDGGRFLNWNVTYRNFQVMEEDVAPSAAENGLLSRLDFQYHWFDKAIELQSNYQLGSGREQRREYVFLEVQKGLGEYIWVDYNNDGVPTVDEFERAVYSDEANYVRVLMPTNDFVRAIQQEMTQSLKLTPANKWKDETGWKGFLSRWSQESSLRTSRRNLDMENWGQFNPFQLTVEDTALIAARSTIRNTLFFQKRNPKFGADYTRLIQNSKQWMNQGFIANLRDEHKFRVRWNLNRRWSFYPTYTLGTKGSEADAFAQRNFDLHYDEYAGILNFQWSKKLRFNLKYAYQEQENKLMLEDFGGEQAFHHDLSTGINYALAGKGSLQADLKYILINYDASPTAPVAFEILQGLMPGQNLVWNLQLNYRISDNIQAQFRYHGRKPAELSTVHVANVNVNYLF